MIAFTCKQCGRQYRVPDEKAGKRAKCPCGNATVVPALADASSVTDASMSPVAKPNICGTLSAVFGGSAVGLCVLGSVLYLILWFTLHDYQKLGVVAGHAESDAGKLLLPKVLNYLSALAAIAAIVCGVVSLTTTIRKRPAIIGITLASAALLIILGFWAWTVSRKTEPYMLFPQVPAPTRSDD
jgi:hypothetical protein